MPDVSWSDRALTPFCSIGTWVGKADLWGNTWYQRSSGEATTRSSTSRSFMARDATARHGEPSNTRVGVPRRSPRASLVRAPTARGVGPLRVSGADPKADPGQAEGGESGAGEPPYPTNL